MFLFKSQVVKEEEFSPLCLQVIFRYALALFKYKEDDILKIHDNVELYQYLRFFTKTVSDGRYGGSRHYNVH